MKTTKKLIVSDGYIRCGHVAIKAHGVTAVEGKGLCSKMMQQRHHLCPIDRVISAQEFANLTGLSVARGASEAVMPKRAKKIKLAVKSVSCFIR